MSITAVISNISRGSLHDGAGVRTVVYFKGCGLRCQWCHNPETFEKKQEIVYAPVKCIHCGKCIEICPVCHVVESEKMLFLRENCTWCGKCAEVCPTGALSLCGERKDVDEVFKEIVKDRHYYETSGGGVTLSGGECLLQADFCVALLKKCREEKIGTVIESAFFVEYAQVEKVLPYVDFFYADLKIADSAKHTQYTGRDNALIVENIRRLSQEKTSIVIRIPVIPNVNDSAEDMQAFGEILRSFSSGIKGVELLKYNPLASSKYDGVGKPYHEFAKDAQTDNEMQVLCEALQVAIGGKCPVFFR